MTHYQSPATLICDDLALGWLSGMDVTCVVQPIASSADMQETWNGGIVNLAADEFRLFSGRLSSGQAEYRTPALSQMWAGYTMTVIPDVPLGDMIVAGGSSRTLIRDPHPGSVRCMTLGNDDVPFTVNGRVVTLTAPASGTVRISFRPVLQMVVMGPWTLSRRNNTGDLAWTLDLREKGVM